ncbi:M48 family metallopeptidase [Desulforamulus aeronauticus]|uniref:YgjP-like metallopeptidase domain-containing protein n=1 Tax=Desulforamulus aeronauticus DSM 10349 TaxID=1121421 RepID=A0A1M6SDA8_9FIRM|nr:SprT family zinc-dependent metalloprotease [Desulforamulus aeronauticus]SHK42527.1 hypothetical protein SAMN02745123_01811 [Desulforamulus aeronauticus DSM 10349]
MKEAMGKNMHTVQLGGKPISYQIRESRRAKHVRFTISSSDGLEVVVPSNYPQDQLETLLKSKQNWILEKLALFSRRVELVQKNALAATQVIRFLGKSYRVVTVFQPGAPQIEIVGDKIIIMLPQQNQVKIRDVLESWLRHQAREVIKQRLQFFSHKLNIKYNQVAIKDQKTRWGSCSSQGNLNFNYRLVMAPVPIIDYLVVHELAHLREMNHSKKFWLLVESVCPAYKAHRQWLKEHGAELTLPF